MARLKPDFEEVIPLKMIPLSLKLNPTVLDNMEAVRAIIKQNRNAYINLAIDAFNHYHRYKMIKKRMNQDAYDVTTYYLEIIKEFEEINQSGILKEL
jgi:predicted methyltransferase